MFKKQNDAQADPLLDPALNNTDINQSSTASINLTQLGNGKSAKVIKFQGGRYFISKLEAMGIVPGTTILKKTASLMKGPIVIEKGEMQFAIGYAMAQKIIIEPIDEG